ncbi:MAG: glycosyltransferase family 9 protein [bacterium]
MPSTSAFPRRWLLIRQGAIGDTILLSSVIQAIRLGIPEAWIEVMGIQGRVELLVGEGLADGAVSAERFPLECLHQEDAPLPPALMDYLGRFDAVVYYTAATYPWLRDKMRIHPSQVMRIHPALPPEGYTRHVTNHYLESLHDFFDWNNPPVPRLALSRQEREAAKQFYLTRGMEPSREYILAMHVGAGSARKQAPVAFFETAARRLQVRQPCALLLTQGPADEPPVCQLRTRLSKDFKIHVIAEQPLRSLSAYLSHADLFIGNDSGITHLAAAVGCPTVAVFVDSDPALWRPRGSHCVILDMRNEDLRSPDWSAWLSRKDFPSSRGKGE